MIKESEWLEAALVLRLVWGDYFELSVWDRDK